MIKTLQSVKKVNEKMCNLYDKNNYVAHIITLKHTLTRRLLLKKCIK